MSSLTEQQLIALRAFAKANGRTWKSKLNHAWMTGLYNSSDDSMNLQQIRNTFGPTWLVRFSLKAEVK
jgi:hypothetical protein